MKAFPTETGDIRFYPEPTSYAIWFEGKPVVTFTQERKVIIEGDIYEAASKFWEILKTTLPQEWTMEVDDGR